jgi:NAD(P)-dependent dehydrogenase (short-subunit alcohol dehydrogenase family)
VSTYGRIDILVNNAGGTVPTPNVEDVPALVSKIQGAPRSDDDYERTVLFHSFAIQMNLISPLWFAIRVYRQMRDQDGIGSIVNISSGTGHPAGSPTLVSYGAAKAGLNHMTRSLAQEWGPRVRVNCLALGPTMTENFRSFVLPKDDPDGVEYFRNVPLKRAGEPAEVGRACVFLCSGAADFINGTTIEIDGGMLPACSTSRPENHHRSALGTRVRRVIQFSTGNVGRHALHDHRTPRSSELSACTPAARRRWAVTPPSSVVSMNPAA